MSRRKLRIALFLALMFIPRVVLPFAAAGDPPVTINADKTPLSSVLEEVKLQTGLSFVYADELVDKVTVTCSLKNIPAEEALERILKNTGIGFRRSSSQIILYPDGADRFISIYGKVVDGKTGEALPYAGISLPAVSRGTTANSEGWFSISHIPLKEFILEVRHLGYFSRTVTVNSGSYRGSLVIELEENALPAPTVIVGEIRNDIISLSSSSGQLTIAAQNLPDLPVLGGRDISYMLQLIPGIAPGNYGASGFHIRGGLPSQNLFLLDGMTLYHTEHSFGLLNAFNPGTIKDVRLYKGAFPSRFGGRLSGVMELTSRSGDFNSFRLNAGTSQLCSQAAADIPLWGKGAVLISARRSVSEFILGELYDRVFNNIISSIVPSGTAAQSTAAPGSYENKSRNIYFYDLFGKATFVPWEKDAFTFTWFSSLDNIKNDQKAESRGAGSNYTDLNTLGSSGLYKWGSDGQSLRWYRQWNSSFNSTLLLSASDYFVEDTRRSSGILTRTYQKVPADTNKTVKTSSYTYTKYDDQGVLNNIKELTLKSDFSLTLTERHAMDFGFSFVNYKTDFRNEEWINDHSIDVQVKKTDTVSNSIVHNLEQLNDDGRLLSLYAQDSWTPAPGLNIEAGLRGLYFNLTGESELEPRLSASYEILENLTIKGAWGSYHQYILQSGDDFQNWYESRSWLLADGRNIKAASAVHTVAGLKYETPGFLFDLELFIKKMENVIERENRSFRLSASGAGSISPAGFLQHGSEIKGADILLQKKSGSLNGWVSCSFSSSEDE
ncbi:MAG: carboxypeptidase-like regulatory domain-containing protein, partial [Syntrophothermus sp.]